MVPGGGAGSVVGKDTVGGVGGGVAEVGGRGRQIASPVAVQADFASTRSAIPPDLVSSRAGAVQEVAGSEVLDPDVIGLEGDDAIAPVGLTVGRQRPEILPFLARVAWLGCSSFGPVDNNRVAVHPPDVEIRRSYQHTTKTAQGSHLGSRCFGVRGRVIVARGYQDPISGSGRVDGCLYARELAFVAMECPD